MELLVLIAIGFALRGMAEHVKKNYRASRDQRVKEVTKANPNLPKSKRKAAARRHAIGWWGREVGQGFPVTRTGWHAAWLAHKAEAHAHEARREDARADAAEAEVARTYGVSGARQRMAAAQAELDAYEAELAAQQAKGSPATGKSAVESAADEVARKRKEREQVTGPRCPSCNAPEGYDHRPGCDPSVPPLPADSVPRDDLADHLKAPMPDPRLNDAQRKRDQNGQRNLCAACGHPGTQTDDLIIREGFRVHQSHTHDPDSGYYEGPAPEQTDELPGGPMYDRAPDGTHKQTADTTASPTTQGAPVADTNYDTVMETARQRADEAEQDAVAAAARHQAAMAHAEDMQAIGVKGATLSAQMELVDQLKHAEDAAKATGEQAAAVRDALAKEHGGIKGAVDDAPVEPAEMPFYQGS